MGWENPSKFLIRAFSLFVKTSLFIAGKGGLTKLRCSLKTILPEKSDTVNICQRSVVPTNQRYSVRSCLLLDL